MTCCGSTRRAASMLRGAAPVAAPPAPPESASQPLRYNGKTILTVRGPFSNRLYRLDPARRRVDADAADAAALLRTGLFAALGD